MEVSKSMREYFSSDTSYNNWLYAKSLAEKVNEYIANGDIVYDKNMKVVLPFTFFFMKEPTIGELSKDGRMCSSWFCCTYNNKGKIVMETSVKVRRVFNSLCIVRKSDIKKLQIV